MAPLDLLTVDEAKQTLSFVDSVVTHDEEVERFITAVSLRIDDLCGPVVYRTITDEVHDGGSESIRLYETPVASVVTLTEYLSGTGTVLTAETNLVSQSNGYLLDKVSTHFAVVYRRSGGYDSTFQRGRRNVAVTYQAGRFPDTASVSAKFKLAAALTLQHMWRPSAGAWAQSPTFEDVNDVQRSPVVGYAVPRAVTELLGSELYPQGVIA